MYALYVFSKPPLADVELKVWKIIRLPAVGHAFPNSLNTPAMSTHLILMKGRTSSSSFHPCLLGYISRCDHNGNGIPPSNYIRTI